MPILKVHMTVIRKLYIDLIKGDWIHFSRAPRIEACRRLSILYETFTSQHWAVTYGTQIRSKLLHKTVPQSGNLTIISSINITDERKFKALAWKL